MQVSVPVEAIGTFALHELSTAAQRLVAQAKQYPVWLFYGEMGAGKTTLIKAICEQLGVHDAMSSPTFSIVNEYKAGDGLPVFHFDFYRIKNELEAYDIGVDEYFNSGNHCFVEWPDRVISLIPPRHASIYLTLATDTTRTISIEFHG
jgi:tRNA threonylcarbamoyladenosine biosynthesis protein TsaE